MLYCGNYYFVKYDIILKYEKYIFYIILEIIIVFCKKKKKNGNKNSKMINTIKHKTAISYFFL